MMTRSDKTTFVLALLDELGLTERQLERVRRMIEAVTPYDAARASGVVRERKR
jgi:hypothetical protein